MSDLLLVLLTAIYVVTTLYIARQARDQKLAASAPHLTAGLRRSADHFEFTIVNSSPNAAFSIEAAVYCLIDPSDVQPSHFRESYAKPGYAMQPLVDHFEVDGELREEWELPGEGFYAVRGVRYQYDLPPTSSCTMDLQIPFAEVSSVYVVWTYRSSVGAFYLQRSWLTPAMGAPERYVLSSIEPEWPRPSPRLAPGRAMGLGFAGHPPDGRWKRLLWKVRRQMFDRPQTRRLPPLLTDMNMRSFTSGDPTFVVPEGHLKAAQGQWEGDGVIGPWDRGSSPLT